MHSPRAALAKKALSDSEQIYSKYLRHTCGVKYATLSAMLLEQLSLSPLQVYWWQRILMFFNKLAASPVGSLSHLTVFDNLPEAFHHGVTFAVPFAGLRPL